MRAGVEKIVVVMTLYLALNTIVPSTISAQCPMCKAAVETATEDGKKGAGTASGLNTGILYLFILPYSMIIGVGVLWYTKYRKRKKLENSEAALSDNMTTQDV